MLGFKRHLSWVVCAWLACQIAGVVAAPILVWQVTASQDGRACDCPVAPGQACPMHQNGKHDGKHDDTTCALRSAFPAPDATLLLQSGIFGILPGRTATVNVFHPSAVVPTSTPVAIAHAYMPDAPPPRA